MTDEQLNSFIAWLLRKPLAYRTITAYISMGARLVHEAAGAPWTSPGERFSSNLVLRGVKRLNGDTVKPKHAITLDLLEDIISKLDMKHNLDDMTFGTACLVLFFCFLRKAHATTIGGTVTKQTILRRHWSTAADGSLILTVFHTKTIQNGERTLDFEVAAMNQRHYDQGSNPICPATAVRNLLSATAGATGDDGGTPLFLQDHYAEGGPSPLTYDRFMRTFKSAIIRLGLNPADYAGHSFRRGGATFAKDAGWPDEVIKAMGDWKSDAYLLYTSATAGMRLRAAALTVAAVERYRDSRSLTVL
jgi:hypothetical protein